MDPSAGQDTQSRQRRRRMVTHSPPRHPLRTYSSSVKSSNSNSKPQQVVSLGFNYRKRNFNLPPVPVACQRGSAEEIVNTALEEVEGTDTTRDNNDTKAMDSNEYDWVGKKSRSVTFDERCVEIPCKYYLTEEDIQAIWWTSEDMFKSMIKSQSTVQQFRRNKKESVKELLHAFSLCSRSSTDSSSSSSSSSSSNSTSVLAPSDSDEVQKSLVAARDARGLEVGLAPIIRVHRRKHVKGVLDCLKNIPSGMSRSQRQRMLAARSTHLSRPCKMLARVLGEMDERDAK